MAPTKNRYTRIIEAIFEKYYLADTPEFEFPREDIIEMAESLGVQLPSNVGDVIYTFRYRADLPDSIRSLAPEGTEWVIRPVGKARYRFALSMTPQIVLSALLAETKIPDATPGVIARYALSDEQALLARLRYNRLIDIFTGVTCYSLQNHLRTFVKGIGQVETDELYVGIDRRGAQFAFPVQAKGGNDKLGIVQIEQDYAMCTAKFPSLLCRPIAAQFVDAGLIALFAFESTEAGLRVTSEKHYRLVQNADLNADEIMLYQSRSE